MRAKKSQHLKTGSCGLAVLLMLLGLALEVEAQNQGIQRLAQELTDSPEVAIRMRAAQGLGRTGTPQAARLLDNARTEEANRSVRLEIVRALRTIAFQRNPGYRNALAAIGRGADDRFEADEMVRLRATEALWEAGRKDLLDPVPLLEAQMDDRSQRLRLAAVAMLRRHSDTAAADALGRIALDKAQSRTIRLKAVEALGAVPLSEGGVVGRSVAASNITVAELLNIPPVIPPASLDLRHERQISHLTRVALDPESSNTLVLRAVKSMGQVKDKSAIPTLRELILNHPHDGIRKQSIKVLSHVMAAQYE